jgi:hypothetical protein
VLGASARKKGCSVESYGFMLEVCCVFLYLHFRKVGTHRLISHREISAKERFSFLGICS